MTMSTMNMKERVALAAKHFGVKDYASLTNKERMEAVKKAAGAPTFEEAWAKMEAAQKKVVDATPTSSATVAKAADVVSPAAPSAKKDTGAAPASSAPVNQPQMTDNRVVVNVAPPANQVVVQPAAAPATVSAAVGPEFEPWAAVKDGLAWLQAVAVGAALWALLGAQIVKAVG